LGEETRGRRPAKKVNKCCIRKFRANMIHQIMSSSQN
jgi:hypothetical protein